MTVRRREPRNIEECENPDCTGCPYCDAMGFTRPRRKKKTMAQKRKKKTASKKRASRKPSKRSTSKRRSGKKRAGKKRARRSGVSMTATVKSICTAFPRECVAAGKKHARALRLYGHTVDRYFRSTQRVGKALLRFTSDKRTGKTSVSF